MRVRTQWPGRRDSGHDARHGCDVWRGGRKSRRSRVRVRSRAWCVATRVCGAWRRACAVRGDAPPFAAAALGRACRPRAPWAAWRRPGGQGSARERSEGHSQGGCERACEGGIITLPTTSGGIAGPSSGRGQYLHVQTPRSRAFGRSLGVDRARDGQPWRHPGGHFDRAAGTPGAARTCRSRRPTAPRRAAAPPTAAGSARSPCTGGP